MNATLPHAPANKAQVSDRTRCRTARLDTGNTESAMHRAFAAFAVTPTRPRSPRGLRSGLLHGVFRVLLPGLIFVPIQSALAAPPVVSSGETDGSDRFSIHFQSTYISQDKNNFRSNYHSPLTSMTNKSEGGGGGSYSWSATAFLGARLWRGGEVFYNPEMFEGMPFSGQLVGLGGVQNGELQKGAYTTPTTYKARMFFRQTIGLGGGRIHIDDDLNQIAGFVDKNRIVLTYGKVASLDYFDQNSYAHDPRVGFQNFSIWSMAAYGYAADGKGYTYGAVGEWYQGDYVLRMARLAVTTLPGGNYIDQSKAFRQNYVDNLELTRFHQLGGQPGAVRALLYRQHAYMAKYDDALAGAISDPSNPAYNAQAITDARSFTTSWGYGLNMEQAIDDDVGVFARWSWNPDKVETLTLDVGHSLSGGAVIKGTSWGRPNDTFGVGAAVNGISTSQINYLSQGFSTTYIGDTQLRYRTEKVAETYYSAQIDKTLYLSFDYQRINNPAYNADRGPVNIWGIRAHFQI